MQVVMLEAPEAFLEERRRKGLDVFDEMWEGVLHVVPPPSGPHQRLALRLGAALLPIAQSRGLVISQGTGLYRPGADTVDYRVPDLVVARPEHATQRGVDGRAELAVEIRSPGDETYAKLGFYAEVGVQELLAIDCSELSDPTSGCDRNHLWGQNRGWGRSHADGSRSKERNQASPVISRSGPSAPPTKPRRRAHRLGRRSRLSLQCRAPGSTRPRRRATSR